MNTTIETLTPETCWNDQAFCAWWDAAHAHQLNDDWAWQTLGTPDDGWALDALLDRFHEGMTPEAAIDEIVEGWEPSDDEMMSAFGTKWHDGL
jgi:hypothetical protein